MRRCGVTISLTSGFRVRIEATADDGRPLSRIDLPLEEFATALLRGGAIVTGAFTADPNEGPQ